MRFVILMARAAALLFTIATPLLLSVLPTQAAEKRVALVIGNASYKVAPRLDNPINDATAVAAAFRRLGFQVIEGYDLPGEKLRATLSQFSEALEDSKAAVVYYSGHGVSLDGENYLLPIDIDPKTPSGLDLNGVSATQILRQMRRDERIAILILDACRDDPFSNALARTKDRAVIGARGLNPIEGEAARGALIAFATDPNNVAFDGAAGQHSPFTKALLNHLEDRGVSIDTVMSRVRSEVWESTKNKQLPWVNTSIIGEFDLNPSDALAVSSAATTPVAQSPVAPIAPASDLSLEKLLWESAQRSNLAADYRAYLDRFPNGFFAAMARNRIAAIAISKASAGAAEAAIEPPAKDIGGATRSNKTPLSATPVIPTPPRNDLRAERPKSAERDAVRPHRQIRPAQIIGTRNLVEDAPVERLSSAYPQRPADLPAGPVTDLFGHGGGGGGGGGGGSSGGGGGAGGGGGGWSDRRLKRNIHRLGTSPSGLNIYAFEYIWGGPTYVGVIAQELLLTRPDAVIATDSGYLKVDYNKIDVAMVEI
jgi:uncharacterized caspase-like protein